MVDINKVFNIPTKCTQTVKYIIIIIIIIIIFIIIKYLLHFSTHPAPSSGRTLVSCSKLSVYSNAVRLVTKHTMNRMWV